MSMETESGKGRKGMGVRPTRLTIKQTTLQKVKPSNNLFQICIEC